MKPLTEFKFLSPEAIKLVRKINKIDKEIEEINEEIKKTE
jgi:hypothetical protein